MRRAIPTGQRVSDRTTDPRPACRNLGRAGASSRDRKSTRLNSSHSQISYAVFCLKKKKKTIKQRKKTCLYSTLGGIVVLSFANCFISCGLAVVCFRCVAHG